MPLIRCGVFVHAGFGASLVLLLLGRQVQSMEELCLLPGKNLTELAADAICEKSHVGFGTLTSQKGKRGIL